MQRQQKKVYLDIIHSFGGNFNSHIHSEISIIEEDSQLKVVYAVGKSIAKLSLQTNEMDFIRLSQNVESIQCMAISPNRIHFAVCQKLRGENFLLLNLYGLKKRDLQIKHFKLPQNEKQVSFKIIAFSPSQPKYACCMTNEPESQLMFLDIGRSRGLAVSNTNIEGTESVGICPTQSHLISIAGRNIFKMFKVQDYAFKQYDEIKKLPKARNYISHAWYDKTKILVGTDRGELFMIGPIGNNFQVKRHLNSLFNQQPLTSICSFTDGFLLGSSHGKLSLWMKKKQNDFEDEYAGQAIRHWQSPQCSPIVSMGLCPLQQTLVIGYKNNSIGKIKSITSEQQQICYIYNGNYTQQISMMDVSLQRPIFVTLSKRQNTLRFYNYKNPRLQLLKRFDAKMDSIDETSNELIHSIALHPIGYYIAVGCSDKLRIYHILESQLRNFREIVLRAACYLKFSHGGQQLAVAYPKQRSTMHKYNIHLINVYNSYTLQEVYRLNDHSSLITELVWRGDDRVLYSVGLDGVIVEWKETQGRKWSQANSKYACIMQEGRNVFVGGVQSNRNVLRMIKTDKEPQKAFSMNYRVSKVGYLTSQWNVNAILVGSEDGVLKVYNAAFDNISEQALNLHCKSIVGLAISPCGRYAISCGKDGSIFIYQVSLTNREGYTHKRLHEQSNELDINPLISVMDEELADIVLTQKNDLNEKQRSNKILEKNIQEMRDKELVQEEEWNTRHSRQIHALELQYERSIQLLKQQLEAVKKSFSIEIDSNNNCISETRQQNQKNLQDIQALFEKKLMMESEKYYKLQGSYKQLQGRNRREIEQYVCKSDQSLQLFKRQFLECFRKAQQIHNNQQQTINHGQLHFNEKMMQMEEEHESEVKMLGKEIKELQAEKTKKSADILSNFQLLKRECRILHEEINLYIIENEAKEKLQAQLRNELQKLKSMLERTKQEVEEKQQVMKMREERIANCQERIVDLSKRKQLLSYRTWEMRQEITPKEEEVSFLKEEIYKLEQQFQKLLFDEKIFREQQLALKRNKEQLHADLGQQKILTKQYRSRINKICSELNEIVQSKSTERSYYEVEMKKLSNKYSMKHPPAQFPNSVEEMERHAKHLDSEMADTVRSTEAMISQRDEEINKITQENAELIKKVGGFRNQKMAFNNQLKTVQKIIDSLKRQLVQIKPLETSKKSISVSRIASQSILKGRIIRGTNYDVNNLNVFKEVKIRDMEYKSSVAKDKLKIKTNKFKELKSQILEHLQTCEDKSIAQWIKQHQI